MKEKHYAGHTREELDKVCECGHTRKLHTVKDKYCFEFNDDNTPCGCNKFKLKEVISRMGFENLKKTAKMYDEMDETKMRYAEPIKHKNPFKYKCTCLWSKDDKYGFISTTECPAHGKKTKRMLKKTVKIK